MYYAFVCLNLGSLAKLQRFLEVELLLGLEFISLNELLTVAFIMLDILCLLILFLILIDGKWVVQA